MSTINMESTAAVDEPFDEKWKTGRAGDAALSSAKLAGAGPRESPWNRKQGSRQALRQNGPGLHFVQISVSAVLFPAE
jgi:hypothetical protein